MLDLETDRDREGRERERERQTERERGETALDTGSRWLKFAGQGVGQ
jgi:hypothetical protein